VSFITAAGLASAVILGSESLGTHDHILLSQIRDPPQPGGIAPRIYIPQAQGRLSVASYDPQDYGGGILISNIAYMCTMKHLESHSTGLISMETRLLTCRLAMGLYITISFRLRLGLLCGLSPSLFLSNFECSSRFCVLHGLPMSPCI
jgi:hypothetical protein